MVDDESLIGDFFRFLVMALGDTGGSCYLFLLFVVVAGNASADPPHFWWDCYDDGEGKQAVWETEWRHRSLISIICPLG